jgi:hypothetical protein
MITRLERGMILSPFSRIPRVSVHINTSGKRFPSYRAIPHSLIHPNGFDQPFPTLHPQFLKKGKWVIPLSLPSRPLPVTIFIEFSAGHVCRIVDVTGGIGIPDIDFKMGLRLRLVHAGESAWACLVLLRCHVHAGACILIAGIDGVRVPVIAGPDRSPEADTVLVEVIDRTQVSVLAGSTVRRTPPEQCEHTPGIRVATVSGVRVSVIAWEALTSSADPVLVIVIDRALVSVVAGRAIRPHPAEWCEHTA